MKKYAVPVIAKKPFLHFFRLEQYELVYLVEAWNPTQAENAVYEVFDKAYKKRKIRNDWSYDVMAAKELLSLTTLNVATPETIAESVRDTLEFVYGKDEH